MSLKDNLAVIAGKLSSEAIRMSGRGLASNLPGRVAEKISTNVLSYLAKQAHFGSIAVTGTNGKSTTTGLVASILEKAELKLVHNRQGANLVSGITAALVNASNWQANIEADYCLLEIDEAALAKIVNQIHLNTILVTNLFRDQLDRFGELDTTSKLISSGILSKNSNAVLNADDPNVAQMVESCPRIFYGIKSIPSNNNPTKSDSNETNSESTSSSSIEANSKSIDNSNKQKTDANTEELAYCSKCGTEYCYTIKFYGQLGHYYCPNCQNKRIEPDIYAHNIILTDRGSKFLISYDKNIFAKFSLSTNNNSDLKAQENIEDTKTFEINLSLPGLFNVYNALAAASLSLALGIEKEIIQQGLSHYSTLFGRSELLRINDKSVLIQLIKNPAGASQAVKAAAANPHCIILIAINDNYADGRDISWLWDADFESFVETQGPFIVSGKRCFDMALRLKYAGIDQSKITTEFDLDKAIDLALNRCSNTQTLWILPTYTCLLELQKIMKAKGINLSGT